MQPWAACQRCWTRARRWWQNLCSATRRDLNMQSLDGTGRAWAVWVKLQQGHHPHTSCCARDLSCSQHRQLMRTCSPCSSVACSRASHGLFHGRMSLLPHKTACVTVVFVCICAQQLNHLTSTACKSRVCCKWLQRMATVVQALTGNHERSKVHAAQLLQHISAVPAAVPVLEQAVPAFVELLKVGPVAVVCTSATLLCLAALPAQRAHCSLTAAGCCLSWLLAAQQSVLSQATDLDMWTGEQLLITDPLYLVQQDEHTTRGLRMQRVCSWALEQEPIMSSSFVTGKHQWSGLWIVLASCC